MVAARTPTLQTHPMSAVDAAWYHIDGPVNTAVVTAVAITARPLTLRRLRAVLERDLLCFDRFRQRVVEQGFPIATPAWQDVDDLDLDSHLRHVALPAPQDDAALRALVDELASTPLDPARPLWQVHLVERVGAGSAMVLRYHHCIGDGTAMMTVASRLFDMPHGSSVRPPIPPRPEPGLVEQASLVLGGAAALLTQLVKTSDPPSPFKGEFGAGKRVAWSEPVDIADVKAIGEGIGAKVNDVLVAATAGALRAYLRGRGIDTAHTTLRAMVPVDLRPAERAGELGNEFGLVILDLPVSQARMIDRLKATKRRMDALKNSPLALAMQLLFDIFGRVPKALEDVASLVFGSKTSLVLTNVIGPRARVGLAGVPVERMMFCVPHPGRELGMGVSILSYAGRATLTVIADAHLVPDPEAITRGFNREFAAMQRRVAGLCAGARRARATPQE